MDYFASMELESPWALHDAFFVAKDGERYVGESYLLLDLNDPEALYQGLTGVRPEYRRRGIAMALKVRVMEYARDRGCKTVKTWNSTLNEGMLSINHKLGFTGHTAWIELEKRLDGSRQR
jgi:GNAT superfamily N-acetyltransferase